jgi:hypothetical protein
MALAFSACGQTPNVSVDTTETGVPEPDTLAIYTRMTEKAKAIQSFLEKNPSYHQRHAILIDMRQNSGRYRLFVFDLDSMKVISKGLVAHGSGSETGYEDSLTFSNIPNSNCTSLGKYKIGAPYTGNFGRSYKLHGLDATNSKAFERYVVLHRYSCVPDVEQPYEICNSLGCPMVSENYFEELDKIIRAAQKPVILEIFY